MKKIIISIVLGMAVMIGIVLVSSFINPIHKDCPKTTFWDGESALGNPVVVMVVKHYQSKWEFRQLRRTSDPKIIDEISKALRGEKYDVSESRYMVIYMAPNGSQKIIPIPSDYKLGTVTSPHNKGSELWDILNKIPLVESHGFDEFEEGDVEHGY